MSRHSKAPKPDTAMHRPPDISLLRSDLELGEVALLRAAVELRGFACHDLADMLTDVIERVYTIHVAAAHRLHEASVIPVGGESRG